MRGLWLGALLLVFLGACVGPESVTCDDGFLCPSTLTCAPNGGCASTIQIASCESRADGESCNTGAGQGTCNNGICLGSQCGNGVIDDGELCDIGIAASGDSCRSDCRKIEVCGDGVVDEAEQCDDGNQNGADGCTSDCKSSAWAAKTVYGGGRLATEEFLEKPTAAFVDRGGNLFISDLGNNRILKVDPITNAIEVVAGAGIRSTSGDGGPATSANFNKPKSIFVDGTGDLYIAERGLPGIIRRVDAVTGLVSTVAGGGNLFPDQADGGAATNAFLEGVYDLFVTGNGDIYIAQNEPGRIRLVDGESGIITTVAGGGNLGFEQAEGGLATNARLSNVQGIHVIGVGVDAELYIAEYDRVRRVTSDGIITTVAGGGNLEPVSAENGLATSAILQGARGIFVVANGESADIYISEKENHRVRRIDSSGIITTVAGGGNFTEDLGDGGLATDAYLYQPLGITILGTGSDAELYVADTGNKRIRVVGSDGVITSVAGTLRGGIAGDGGLATSTRLSSPEGIFVVGAGTEAEYYIADARNDRIRHVTSDGVITTVAGGGSPEDGIGDGGLATDAELRSPESIFATVMGSEAELYIASSNGLVRHVDSNGVITTVAGGGELDPDLADGGLATNARLRAPKDVFVVGSGDNAEIFIADSLNHRIRRVGSDGIITTVAGSGELGFPRSYDFGGDGDLATKARLYRPSGIYVVGTGASAELYIADTSNDRIRHVDSDGIISTIAGGGSLTPADGDGDLATNASLSRPADVHVVGAGADAELYIAGGFSSRIRHVDSDGIITTVAGINRSGFAGDGALATDARLNFPGDVYVTGTGAETEFFIADTRNSRIRRVDEDGVIKTVAGEIYAVPSGLLASEGVGDGTDPQGATLRDGNWLIAGGNSGTVLEVNLSEKYLDVLAGRTFQSADTLDFARFRSEDFGAVKSVAYNEKDKLIYLTEGNRVHVVTTDDAENGVNIEDPDTWTIAVLAGDGTGRGIGGYSDGDLATSFFRVPEGLLFDDVSRTLYVADAGNHIVRAIDVDTQTVSTIAGTPQHRGYFGDGKVATDALLYEPVALTSCPNGDMFIAELGSHHIRRVAADTSIVTTVLGVGVPGSSGIGSPSTIFPVDSPRGLACDAYGNLFVTSRTVLRLLAASDSTSRSGTGVVDGTGSVETIYQNSQNQCLTDVAVEKPDDIESPLFLTDSCAGAGVELELTAASQ